MKRDFASLMPWIVSGCLFMLASGTSFAGTAPDEEDSVAFLKRARQNWQVQVAQPKAPLQRIEPGKTAFVAISALIRGQDEISVDNTYVKMRERIAAGDVSWSDDQNKWKFAHDNGRSSVPLKDPIQVIRGPQGFVVTDGHHDVFLSLYLGAEQIAVEVKDDLSHIPDEDFWIQMKQRQLVLLNADAKTLARNLPEMPAVLDNPNRYLAGMTALKIKAQGLDAQKGERLLVTQAKGSKAPLWIKVNGSIPFIEFEIARALKDAGVVYQREWGKDVPPDVLEHARKAMATAQASDQYPQLKRIWVISDQAQAVRLASDANFLETRLANWSAHACANQIRSTLIKLIK
jgi:hypothetical protein